MLEYLSYITCVGLLIAVMVYLYVRVKYGFWYTQPMYYRHSMFRNLGIIEDAMPDKTKYTNFKDIETIVFSQLTPYQITKWTHLIAQHYRCDQHGIFHPKTDHLVPYFVGHSDRAFISFYYQDTHLLDVNHGNLITERNIVGSITSRPLSITIFKDKDPTPFRAHCIDYLCVKDIKQDLEPQLIQTHYYNQRHIESSMMVSIFKRKKAIDGVVPLCVYSTYQFPVNTWTKPDTLSAEYKVLDIHNTNYRFVHDFIHDQKQRFDIAIEAGMANILELIKTHNIFITAILCDEHIVACYCFRKSCIEMESGLEMLTCIASICNCEETIFVQGFKISFWKIAAEHYFGYAAIEDTSHNHLCIQNIIQKTTPSAVHQTNYYFYNFAYPTFAANRLLLIH